MKRTTRKLMSLLMVLAIVCTLAPAALASGINGILGNSNFWWTIPGMEWYCPSDPLTHSHALAYSYVNTASHQVYCANGCGYNGGQEAHTSDCNCNPYSSGWYDPSYGYSYVASLSSTSMSLNVGSSGTLSVSPLYSGYTFDSVEWTSSNPAIVSVSTSGYWYDMSAAITGVAAGQAYVYATVYKNYTAVDTVACLVTVGNGTFYISGSSSHISAIGGTVQLTAVPTYTGSQLDLTQLQWSSNNPSVAYVTNAYGTGTAVGSSVTVYGSTAGQATIYAQLPNTNYYATYEVTVGVSAATGGVTYSLTTGQSKTLDAQSFENFWDTVTAGTGDLDYIVLGTSSGSVGQLTYKRTGATTTSSAASNPFYVKPGYGQYGISAVTFTPSTATSTGYRTGTLAVPFTAYGTDSYYSSSNISASGVLYIMVTNGTVADISYEHTGTGLNLVPADFVSVYRSAMNVTATSPTIYIQFKNAPINGDLYYNYVSGYAYGTKLTSANVESMRFSTYAATSYSLSNVSYVPGSGRMGDTISYVAYNAAVGGTPLYEGKIIFGAGVTPEIKYYTTINTPVEFTATDFYNNKALRSYEYVTFGTPSAGTLYKNYANGTGTRVTSSTAYATYGNGSATVPSINALTYVPSSNYTGVAKIPFTATNLLSGDISGTVKVYVAKAFSDVSSGYSWASDYILRLTAEKVVSGNDDGTFAPGRALTYGEALKMILEATGTTATQATTGHWAKNYLTAAFREGVVSTTSIDLDAKITREAVAELAAKALGLSKASSVTGAVAPTDTTNGYVYALYNVGILNGNTVGGRNYYYGDNTINRAEIAKIICLVSDYHEANP